MLGEAIQPSAPHARSAKTEKGGWPRQKGACMLRCRPSKATPLLHQNPPSSSRASEARWRHALALVAGETSRLRLLRVARRQPCADLGQRRRRGARKTGGRVLYLG